MAWILEDSTERRVSATKSHARCKRLIKPAAFISSLAPLAGLSWQAVVGGLGANPVEKLLHQTGDWALIFLWITLSIAPLQHLTGWSWPGELRRMMGLCAFFYAGLHFLIYVGIDQLFSWESIVKDVMNHKRITVGLASFILLIPPAMTSSNRMVLRLGVQRWQALHRLVYLAAVGGVIHYLWLVKKDRRTPLIYAGVLAVLLGYRVVAWGYARWVEKKGVSGTQE